jgi:hypothetical protein
MDPYAKRPFLRSTLAFKYAWWYYAAIVVDPILRFNFILYAVYGHDVQHSTFIAFAVALSEVSRRGIWTLFRVENEHCAKCVCSNLLFTTNHLLMRSQRWSFPGFTRRTTSI